MEGTDRDTRPAGREKYRAGVIVRTVEAGE